MEEAESNETIDMDESEDASEDATGDGGEAAAGEVVMEATLERYQDVQDQSFDELQLPGNTVDEIQQCWSALLSRLPTREAAGEAIYDAIMEEAPGVANLFKSPKSVFAMRFINGLNGLITELRQPSTLKKQVETMGFLHLDYDMSVPRVKLVSDCILQVMEQELGARFTSSNRICITALLNYVGGAFIFIRRELSGRIKVIQRSWRLAQRAIEEDPQAITENMEKDEKEDEEEKSQTEEPAEHSKEEKEERTRQKDTSSMQVPTDFNGMFLFNAAVMGYGEASWMKLVLGHLDAIAVNVANSSRMQEECFVLSIELAKFKDNLNLPEFKAVMLAALRSILPDEWNMDHEVAWNWLWENVERIISSTVNLPRNYAKLVKNFLFGRKEEDLMVLRSQTFKLFFMRCPSGQDFFKQSQTRLFFILDKNFELVMDLFDDPKKVVEELSGLGLRHVGYGVPVEMFPPFVSSIVDAVAQKTDDDMIHASFHWAFTLISKILMRVVLEGSTIVMKAINLNDEAALRKAIAVAPRSQRATELLNITVGTQSFSPLFWSIDSGSLNSARAMIQDLLTIRADREVYYYGCDELFRRHPDIVRRLCASAPTLLPDLLDGFIWRSRLTKLGMRRVNFYIKYLIQDLDGNFATAISDFVDHGDPMIASHPCVSLACDTVWFKYATFYFLMGRCYFFFQLVVFATSQTLLVSHDYTSSNEEQIVIFICRALLYFIVLPSQVGTMTRKFAVDCTTGNRTKFLCLPLPASIMDWHTAARFALMWVMLFLFTTEPVFWCLHLGHWHLTTNCAGIEETKNIYGILSALGMLLYWALLLDFSVFSTRISAFLLVCGHVVGEVGLFLVALAFLLLAFSTSISALNHHLVQFDGVHIWLRALAQIVLGMFPVSNYDSFQEEPAVFLSVGVFVVAVFIFLLNLLVAQLNQSYHEMFADMQGNARLQRARVICSVMESAPRRSWRGFLSSLGFERPLEFNEGDIGMPGGLQVLEPANAVAVTTDAVKRYGGSTAPTMPWPAEVEPTDVEKERFDRLEKLILKSSREKGSKGRKAGSTFGNSSSMVSSDDNSNHSRD